jgi:ubiquinone/menaquinone biosynthesis C-methylase UbiE
MRKTSWVRLPGAILLSGLLAQSSVGARGPGETPTEDDRATVTHDFEDVERWSALFDDPARGVWQRPSLVVRVIGIEEGDVVADLGAGTGYFTSTLSAAVGPRGKVYAVDVEPKLLEHLRAREDVRDRPNVTTLLAAPDDPKLPAREVDVVLVVDTWHHIDRRRAYLDKLAAALSPRGRVAIVDWHEGELPVGPPPGHKLARDKVVAEFEGAGWSLSTESVVLPYQYVLVFRPLRPAAR